MSDPTMYPSTDYPNHIKWFESFDELRRWVEALDEELNFIMSWCPAKPAELSGIPRQFDLLIFMPRNSRTTVLVCDTTGADQPVIDAWLNGYVRERTARWYGWTISGEEAPPREHHPLALPAPDTTERLRLWSNTFDLIEELPAVVKQDYEGWISVPSGGRLTQSLYDSLKSGKQMWLSVDGTDGRWLGRLAALHWKHDRNDALAEFIPEPECIHPRPGDWTSATATSRAAWATGHPSYPQA